MKKLSELYDCLYDTLIKDVSINSKTVKSGDIFVCTMGVTADRHDFVLEAVKNGASAIIASKPISVDVPVIYVDDTNKELTKVAKKLFDNPQDKLSIIATTGTNGKTTVASIIQDMIGNDKCGYMGTNGIASCNFSESIRNTCPDADRLYKYMDRFVKSGNKYLSMEASSEALLRDRLWGVKFDTVVYTNITQDHMNIHKTIENYVSCKLKLLDLVKEDGYAILNIDDKYYDLEKEYCKCNILTYGKNNKADLKIVSYTQNISDTVIEFKYLNNTYSVISPLIGEFNIYNLAAAILVLLRNNYDMTDIIERISFIKPLKGRVEMLDFKQDFKIILDYAHTPDAFVKLFDLLNNIKTGRIITVSGSAGGREKDKRGLMGKILLDNSDYVIFTMDDPRDEDVNQIIDNLVSLSDKTNYERIINRVDAINKALSMAKASDIVLVAGKGRDDYMAIGDKYINYCDYDVIKEYFK